MPARLSPRNRAKRGAKTAGAQSEDVPLFTRRRTGGEWVEVATQPHHQQAIAAQSREARCKNSRSAERGCSSVHPPPNRRRMGGGSNPAPPPTGYRRAIARSAVQKQPERRALRPQARFGAQPPQAALGAEIGCSSVHPPPNRRRMGGGSNPAPPPTGYRRAIARSAVQKQPERRALRPQARFGAQPPQAALGAEIGCSSVHPPPNRRRMGGGDNLTLLLGKQQTPHHRQQAIATPRKVGT